MKKITFIIEKDENGFSASAEDFNKHSIVTMGDDLSELKANILDAVNLQAVHNGTTVITENNLSLLIS